MSGDRSGIKQTGDIITPGGEGGPCCGDGGSILRKSIIGDPGSEG